MYTSSKRKRVDLMAACGSTRLRFELVLSNFPPSKVLNGGARRGAPKAAQGGANVSGSEHRATLGQKGKKEMERDSFFHRNGPLPLSPKLIHRVIDCNPDEIPNAANHIFSEDESQEKRSHLTIHAETTEFENHPLYQPPQKERKPDPVHIYTTRKRVPDGVKWPPEESHSHYL